MGQVWRVGAIMREPKSVVDRFVRWYQRLGAADITIFFDDPDDPVQEGLPEGVRAIPCTPDFWKSLSRDPDGPFVKRQNAALTWLYQQYTDGWLLNVDADELLWPRAAGVAALLDHSAPQAVSVRIRTAEYLGSSGQKAVFRLPMDQPTRRRVYGEDAVLFGPRREGLVGHSSGKSFVRCGEHPLRLRQHWPERPSGKRPLETVLGAESGSYLLHVIAEDYETWRDKLDWRIRSAGFTQPLTERIEALRSENDAGLKDLFQRLHHGTPQMVERLKADGVCLEIPRDAIL